MSLLSRPVTVKFLACTKNSTSLSLALDEASPGNFAAQKVNVPNSRGKSAKPPDDKIEW
jgi:hypothetical protein